MPVISTLCEFSLFFRRDDVTFLDKQICIIFPLITFLQDSKLTTEFHVMHSCVLYYCKPFTVDRPRESDVGRNEIKALLPEMKYLLI